MPLLDISLSLGIFQERYDFTFKNVWFVIDFVWKLLTAVLVFPKVAGATVRILPVAVRGFRASRVPSVRDRTLASP